MRGHMGYFKLAYQDHRQGYSTGSLWSREEGLNRWPTGYEGEVNRIGCPDDQKEMSTSL